MNLIDKIMHEKFPSQSGISIPAISRTITNVTVVFAVILFFFFTFVPWQQSSIGEGHIIVLDPNERLQGVDTQVSGRILHWFVKDGDHVQKGMPIVEIADIDPDLVKRLQKETSAKRTKLEVAIVAAETARKDFDRQESLFTQGLSSSKTFEQAKINYQKMMAEVAMAESDLLKSEVTLSRQEIRMVRAPGNGTILNVLSGSGSVLVKEGDSIATFLPDATQLAVEVFVPGIDLPLIYKGRLARLQFEGWPAVQFSGWPSIAVGTFEGQVSSVDPSITKNGKYRVVIVPTENSNWPDQRFLRQGTKGFSWILLDEVKVGYEIWRRVNGFPASMEGVLENVKSSTK
jgi:multidrug efflux pump subunit AcrA (membrane-fusion protein)